MAATAVATESRIPSSIDRRDADAVIRSLGVLARAQELGDADRVLERLAADVHAAMGAGPARR